MTFHWRQAATSALAGFVAAAAVAWLLEGSFGAKQANTALLLGLGVGAARVIAIGRPA